MVTFVICRRPCRLVGVGLLLAACAPVAGFAAPGQAGPPPSGGAGGNAAVATSVAQPLRSGDRIRIGLDSDPPRIVQGDFDSCDSARVRIWNDVNRIRVRTLYDRSTVLFIERALLPPPVKRIGAGYYLAGGPIAGAGLGFVAAAIADLSAMHNSGAGIGVGGTHLAQGLALGAVIGAGFGLHAAQSRPPEPPPPAHWQPVQLPESCSRGGPASAGGEGYRVCWTISW